MKLPAQPESAPTRTRVSGRRVVIGMFAFGVLMTGALGLYWELYTRPFRGLQEAIDREFPGSSPRVIGGRHKSHTPHQPAVLRIVVGVNFDPTQQGSREAQDVADRLGELARKHMDLSGYDTLEVHLLQRIPERENRQQSFTVPISDTD